MDTITNGFGFWEITHLPHQAGGWLGVSPAAPGLPLEPGRAVVLLDRNFALLRSTVITELKDEDQSSTTRYIRLRGELPDRVGSLAIAPLLSFAEFGFQLEHEFRCDPAFARLIAFDPTGRFLGYPATDSRIRLLDLDSPARSGREFAPACGRFFIRPGHPELIAAGEAGDIVLHGAAGMVTLLPDPGRNRQLGELLAAFTPDGTAVVFAVTSCEHHGNADFFEQVSARAILDSRVRVEKFLPPVRWQLPAALYASRFESHYPGITALFPVAGPAGLEVLIAHGHFNEGPDRESDDWGLRDLVTPEPYRPEQFTPRIMLVRPANPGFHPLGYEIASAASTTTLLYACKRYLLAYEPVRIGFSDLEPRPLIVLRDPEDMEGTSVHHLDAAGVLILQGPPGSGPLLRAVSVPDLAPIGFLYRPEEPPILTMAAASRRLAIADATGIVRVYCRHHPSEP